MNFGSFRIYIADSHYLGDLESVESIMKDPNAPLCFRDSRGFTPLHNTIKNGHEVLCNLLLSDERVDQSDALHASVEYGRQMITKSLLQKNFDVNGKATTEVFGRG